MKFWLDSKYSFLQIYMKLFLRKISISEAKIAVHWSKQGYLIVNQLFDESSLDEIWKEYEEDLNNADAKKRFKNNFPDRQLNPHQFSPSIKNLMSNGRLLNIINFLSGSINIPFQSISSHCGSEQKAHSDAIHMTTKPLGGLTAAWIAFEDIKIDCGPLEYYPASHRLPYVLSKNLGIDPSRFDRFGYKDYTEIYEPHITSIIKKNKLNKSLFLARKGDVLFWHHNLLHGGSKIINPSASRKSLVFHYFSKDAICYHDLIDKTADLSTFL